MQKRYIIAAFSFVFLVLVGAFVTNIYRELHKAPDWAVPPAGWLLVDNIGPVFSGPLDWFDSTTEYLSILRSAESMQASEAKVNQRLLKHFSMRGPATAFKGNVVKKWAVDCRNQFVEKNNLHLKLLRTGQVEKYLTFRTINSYGVILYHREDSYVLVEMYVRFRQPG